MMRACRRCGGSGRFSFNLVRGTVCFACNGAGQVKADPKADARRAATKLKREAAMARRAELAAQVWAELSAALGPFPDTPAGHWQLVEACKRAHGGKTPGDLVDDRLFPESC